ncbi:hypothetical protein ARMGADRAFT_431679 [Armillaria gallica]|uniref:Uncharacterized protein n=1 Tax=Armillaria gallica TaxID=47427 RepID=A0A2H3D2R8_ARMGA|nr:hypothetical protein ARMGADRAFT_431679 [Armillaria gallica]
MMVPYLRNTFSRRYLRRRDELIKPPLALHRLLLHPFIGSAERPNMRRPEKNSQADGPRLPPTPADIDVPYCLAAREPANEPQNKLRGGASRRGAAKDQSEGVCGGSISGATSGRRLNLALLGLFPSPPITTIQIVFPDAYDKDAVSVSSNIETTRQDTLSGSTKANTLVDP